MKPTRALFAWLDEQKKFYSVSEFIWAVLEEVEKRSIGPAPVILDLKQEWFEEEGKK